MDQGQPDIDDPSLDAVGSETYYRSLTTVQRPTLSWIKDRDPIDISQNLKRIDQTPGRNG